MTEAAPSPGSGWRLFLRRSGLGLASITITLGAAMGATAAVVYLAMIALQELIWGNVGETRWLILPITLVGGALIGWTRLQDPGTDLENQIAEARSPEQVHLRETFWLALGAIIAVGFGGAIGPEAGIVAVAAQLSAIVALKLGKSAAERRTLSEAGVSGALAGFYGSPASGPVHTENEGRAPKGILFVSGIAGFAAFVILAEAVRPGALHLMHLPRLTAEAGHWDALIAIVPGMAGALAGAFYLWLRTVVTVVFNARVGGLFWPPVAGGLALGLLCTLAPVLLFSGHGEIAEMVRIGQEDGARGLVFLAIGKALACALCIGSHWRGGVVFPMCFAGGALGGATLFFMPGFDPIIGVATGMAAAAAVGMTRPVVAGLIMLFILGGGLAVPVFVGTVIGWGALRLLPPRLVNPGGH